MARRTARAPALVQRTEAKVDSLPAPVGGWNARDAWANMAPTDAVQLTNLFPDVSSCNLRGGCTRWATGMNGQVETLLCYAGAATNKFFAIDAGGKNIYDITAGGVVGTPVVTGLSNARWEYTNVATPGGNFLYAVNGVDSPLLYDGTTWSRITTVSTPVSITFTDGTVTTNNLSHVYLFKNRLWFIEKNRLRA